MEQQTRQEYIRAAVTFLQNPKLIDNPLKDKLKFLRDKGLNELEVDEALNLALISRPQKQSGKWNFLLVLGLCLGGYKIYQAYLESRDTHLSKKQGAPQKADDRKTDNQDTARDYCGLSSTQPAAAKVSLNDILETIGELKQLMEKQKGELQSVKSLMLSQHQFATPPVIPEWQMKKSTTSTNTTSANNHLDTN